MFGKCLPILLLAGIVSPKVLPKQHEINRLKERYAQSRVGKVQSRSDLDTMDEILYNYLLVKNNRLATYGYTSDDFLNGTDAKAKCVPTKDKDTINVYGAMTGYDIIQGNPEASLEDPGVKARIFMHDCSHGYYSFVTDIGEDVQCDSGFSMKTISSMEEYEEERKSSSNTAFSAKVKAKAKGWGVKAKASASFAMATDSNERASERVLSELDGEIEMAKATCFTHSVTIAENVRPVFTQNFINYLVVMDAVAKSGDYDEKVSVMRRFLNEFGTHFAKTTKLGAQIIFERRFSSKSTSSDQKQQRSECVKIEAAASLSVSGYGYGIEGEAEYTDKHCEDVKAESSFDKDESFESTVVISRGSRPTSLDEWITSDFQPTPIQRYLEEITELFRDEWMTESEFYGFTKDLSGTHIRAMYDNLLPNYCKIMSFGTMDADCNYISCDDFDCNSGTCSDDSGYPVCTCPDDVYGENCQILNACEDGAGTSGAAKGWKCENYANFENCNNEGWLNGKTCGLSCQKIGATSREICEKSILTRWLYGTATDTGPYTATMDVHPNIMYNISIEVLAPGMTAASRYVSSAYLNGYDYLHGECMMEDWNSTAGITTACNGAANGLSMYSCPLMATQKRFPTGKLTIVMDFVDPNPTCSCFFGSDSSALDKYGVAGPECYETANNGIQYNYVGLTNIAGMAKVTLMPSIGSNFNDCRFDIASEAWCTVNIRENGCDDTDTWKKCKKSCNTLCDYDSNGWTFGV